MYAGMTDSAAAPPHAGLQDAARAWFEHLRDRICDTFEAIEAAHAGPLADRAPGRFEQRAWTRPTEDQGHGGGGQHG